jgi:glycosyltransferase involved in cell wall biosynthesis
MKKTLLLADANSNHTRKWILLLKKQQHQVALFSFYPAYDDWYEKNEIECHSFYNNNKVSLIKKLRYPFAFFKAKKVLNHFQPELVNAHYATSYGLLGVLLKPKKLIINFWGSDVFVFPKKSFLHAKLLRFILSKSDLVCSSSLVMSSEINRYTNREIAYIPFGIDLNEYPRKSSKISVSKEKTIVLGTVKTLESVYRIDVAIEAVRILNQTFDYQFELHIAGSGSLESELKAHATNAVKFHGKIQQSEVPAFLHNLDLFLNTSDFESFGVSTIEAMACGIPVIAHNAGGSAEIITDESSGFLYSPNIPEELAVNIYDIVENGAILNEIADNAHRLVDEKYSITQTLIQLEKYF